MYHGCGTKLCTLDCVRYFRITATTADKNKSNLATTTTTTVATEGYREKAEEAAKKEEKEAAASKEKAVITRYKTILAAPTLQFFKTLKKAAEREKTEKYNYIIELRKKMENDNKKMKNDIKKMENDISPDAKLTIDKAKLTPEEIIKANKFENIPAKNSNIFEKKFTIAFIGANISKAKFDVNSFKQFFKFSPLNPSLPSFTDFAKGM